MGRVFMVLVFIFFLEHCHCAGQQFVQFNNGLCTPLAVPLTVSGNYGDIRGASFHFGIDYTTNGQRGLPIFAIDSGYIARIKVESGGYGRAIYINHCNGIMSVYAHLDSFSPTIACFVKEIQYRSQSFAQDILLDSTKFKVKKCEVIGYSGNSGLSTGPHLHFELRKTDSQHTIHPFIFALPVYDSVPPTLDKILIYPKFRYLSKQPAPAIEIPVIPFASEVCLKDNCQMKEYITPDSVWDVPSDFFVGLQAYDNLTLGGRPLSFYSSQIFVDSISVFEMCFDELPFSETGYVNGILDYQRKFFRKEVVILQYLYPNFSITPVKKAIKNGLIHISDTLMHTVTVRIADFSGNQCVFSFKVRRSNIFAGFAREKGKMSKSSVIPAGKLWTIQREGFKVIFFANSLYLNSEIQVKKLRRSSLLTGYLVEVGNESIPLKNPITLEFSIRQIPHRYWSKLRVVRLKGNGHESIGGEIEAQWIKARTKNLGSFTVAIDTLAPVIKFLNIKDKGTATGYLQLQVQDNLSGIKSWAGFIDGQWVLFEYDKKNDELRYNFDEKCPPTGQLHSLEVQVEDNCGNKSAKSLNFVY